MNVKFRLLFLKTGLKAQEILLRDVNPEEIVLDDAFQHRWINRDVNILIIEQRFLTGKSFLYHNLLPTGNMREPFSSVKRADAIMINRKFSERKKSRKKEKNIFRDKKIFTANYKAIHFIDVVKTGCKLQT